HGDRGHPVFRGSPAEVMYQHQHAPLPLEQLEGVPERVVALLEVLLEKDPSRRFQNPAELLKAMPTIMDSINGGRTMIHQNLHKMPADVSSAVTNKPIRTSLLTVKTLAPQLSESGA